MRALVFLIVIISFPSNVVSTELDCFLIGSINNCAPRKQKIFYIKKNDTLKLYPVLNYNDTLVAPVDFFRFEKKYIKTTKHLTMPVAITWYKIQPILREYSNLWTRNGKNRKADYIEPIYYEKHPLKISDQHNMLDVISLIRENNFGTYYISIELDNRGRDQTIFSETALLSQKYPYQIIQIVYRKDDTYIGYLTELLNTPFIIAPKKTTDGFHETDFRIGSDCAAFAIYGKRRQGYKMLYMGPRFIYKYLLEIEKSALWPQKAMGTEIYVNEKQKYVQVGSHGISTGDIVHFGEQVSVFYKDLGIKGLLDKNDLLFQCYKNSPYFTTIEKSEFYHRPIRIFKWKKETK